MGDPLTALRRELHELQCLAVECRAEGSTTAAVLYEEDAAVVERRIATLEHADGLAYGPPMDGRVAA